MASREKWYNKRARIAEEHLKSIPYEKLGPAGKVLVDNPRDRSAKNSRERLKGIEGGSSKRDSVSQPPLLCGVPDIS